MTPITLDSWLEDAAVPRAERLEQCRAALAAGETYHLHTRCKCATWAAYRAIEDEAGLDEAARGVERAIDELAVERSEMWAARWGCSLAMALAYLRMAQGIDARELLRRMRNFNWIAGHPATAVNVCRSQALLAACEGQAGNADAAARAITACRAALEFAVPRWPLLGAHNCQGHELVLAAKAVHVAIALLPHIGLPHQGAAFGAAMILAIDPSEPFRRTLSGVLPA